MSENLTSTKEGAAQRGKGIGNQAKRLDIVLGRSGAETYLLEGMTTPLFSPCPLLQAFLLLGCVVVGFETEPRYIA